MRVLRVYHGGRDPAHRARDRALHRLGVQVVLVVPTHWPGAGNETRLGAEPFAVVELPVRRAGDVNRHTYAESDVAGVLAETGCDLLDVHEEPVSLAARQWLRAAPAALPVTLYTAQNVDKRFPPPFDRHERAALARADALWPCSRQAGAVARGKGFSGPIRVLPLGYDDTLFAPASPPPPERDAFDDRAPDGHPGLRLGLVGRLEPEKGVLDAVRVLDVLPEARLALAGHGSEEASARASARALGVADRLFVRPWLAGADLAEHYRRLDVLLVPSRSTPRWVEQFGRVVVEAQACDVPVAGYATGALPDVVADGGLLVPEGDVAALADAVAALTCSREAGRVARRRLSRQRTWSAVAGRQRELYEQVLAARHRDRTGDGGPFGNQVGTPVGRTAARAEFGATAVAGGQLRPFAMPVLRRSPGLARPLGAIIDAVRATTTRPAHR